MEGKNERKREERGGEGEKVSKKRKGTEVPRSNTHTSTPQFSYNPSVVEDSS